MLPWQWGPTSGEAAASEATAYALSLGSLCAAAKFLQQHQLRVHAGPLDWVFSSPEMVAHCLDDDFAAFLDRAQYVPIEDGFAGHRLYSAMIGHRTIFNHHNPLLASDHEHFERCVARLRAVLLRGERTLFLWVGKQPAELPAVHQLFSALRRRGATNFELLVVGLERHSTADIGATLIDELGVPAEAATLRVWTQRCRGGHDGLTFNDAADAACFERLVLGGRRFALAPDPLPPRPQPQRAGDEEDTPPGRRRMCAQLLKRVAKRAGLGGGASAWREGVVGLMSPSSSLSSTSSSPSSTVVGDETAATPLPVFWAPVSDEETEAVLRRMISDAADGLPATPARAACLVAVREAPAASLQRHLDGATGLRELMRLERGADCFRWELAGATADDAPVLHKGRRTQVAHAVLVNWSIPPVGEAG